MEVVEIFKSIEGESFNSGKLTKFVRFAGCNLKCEYCDTKWANKPVHSTLMSVESLVKRIAEDSNITLTGGEPLLQSDLKQLLIALTKSSNAIVNIETNGSINIRQFENLSLRKQGRLRFSMDFKIGQFFHSENLRYLSSADALKFVIRDEEDFAYFLKLWKRDLQDIKCEIYLSPCFGVLAGNIVEKMKEFSCELFGSQKYKFETRVKMQLQIHKYIWNPAKRGV